MSDSPTQTAAERDEGVRLAKETFAEGMASMDRRRGEVPNIRENEKLAAAALERMERRAKVDKPQVVRRDERPEGNVSETLQAKAAKKGFRFLFKEADGEGSITDIATKGGEQALEIFKRLNARMQLLLSKHESGPLGAPSWRAKVMAAYALKAMGCNPKRYSAELLRVAEESNEVFGDWKKPPERKIYG